MCWSWFGVILRRTEQPSASSEAASAAPELAWGNPVFFFESPDKIFRIFVSKETADVLHAVAGVQKISFRFLESYSFEKLQKAVAGGLLDVF